MKRIVLALLFALIGFPAYAQQWDRVNGSMQVRSGPSAPLVIIDQTNTSTNNKILSLRANGTEKCSVDVDGDLVCAGSYSFTGQILAPVTPTDCSAPQYSFTGDTDTGVGYAGTNAWNACADGVVAAQFTSVGIGLGDTRVIRFGNAADAILAYDAAGIIAQRNGTNAQTSRVYNTYTSATNYEAFSVDWQTQAGVAMVGTRTAATGTVRPLRLVAQNSSAADVYSSVTLTDGPFVRIDRATATLGAVNTGLAATFFQIGGALVSTATSGTVINTAILPTYNQASGTAANTDFLINRTSTATGSGAQYLIQAQDDSTNKFTVMDTGATTVGAGTTALAPLTIPSGTNLTAAAAGAVENDGVAFYQTVDTTNGRTFDDSWTYFRLTGSGTGITSIADFFGSNSAIPLVASGIYEIEWNAYFSQATAGTATWTVTTATTALATLTGEYMCSNIAGIGAVGAPQTAAINVTSSSATAFPVTGTEANAVTHYCRIRVMLQAGAGASNTRLRLTMGAGTATPLINSYFRARRLPAGNTGTFVP